MLAALVAPIHKTEPPVDQVLEVVAACCLPQLLGQTAAVEKIKSGSSQVKSSQCLRKFEKTKRVALNVIVLSLSSFFSCHYCIAGNIGGVKI